MGSIGEMLISLSIDTSEVRNELQRISEELYNAAQQADPYLPSHKQWQAVPWAKYHTVDADGKGVFWRNGGIVLGADAWYQDKDTLQKYEDDPETYLVAHCGPWEASLRVRPEGI